MLSQAKVLSLQFGVLCLSASVVISIATTAEANVRTKDLLELIGSKRKVPRHAEGE
jgi:hypothetical protein